MGSWVRVNSNRERDGLNAVRLWISEESVEAHPDFV